MDATDRTSFIDNLVGLSHYGKKGMRWGVTTNPDGSTTGTPVSVGQKDGKKVKTKGGGERPASEDAIKAAVGKQVAKKSSTDALSNDQLQAVVKRMQLEANYKQLTKGTKGPGRKFIEQMFLNKNARNQQLENIDDLKTQVVGRQVGRAIMKTDLSDIGK